MNSTIRRGLWAIFGGLFVFVTLAATVNLMVLQREKKRQARLARVSEPLLFAVMSMDASISSMLSAARGYTLSNGRSEFLAQYDESVRDFERKATAAAHLRMEPRDGRLVNQLRSHFLTLKEISDRQLQQTDVGRSDQATAAMLEAARQRRSALDFAGSFYERERIREAALTEELAALRLALTLMLVGMSIGILLVGVFSVLATERWIARSMAGQVRRTEAIIGGMADGIMLVDESGRLVFINPAGEELLGAKKLGVPIEKEVEVFGFRNADGTVMDASAVPAAQALSTGNAVKDVIVMIDRGDSKITVSMSAIPLHEEDERVSGVITSFRDVTERRKLEEEMQLQAERAQILADAGAFFASNVDPSWVTQAIAERVAEVLGDWAAVILREPGMNQLRVASIYHRDISSLGLARSFVDRQPMIVGDGIFGQVVGSGSLSLTSNLDGTTVPSGDATQAADPAFTTRIASLLVLPLRNHREIIGALVIAATDPARRMIEKRLPLAEVLAERATLAIENARLYSEQVDARRKLEDLSRLKDEFLSIASHELRTPVTSIKGYTQLAKTLIQENDLSTSVEYLNIALDQIDRMSRLIIELLDVSRIETGRLDIRSESLGWLDFVRGVVARSSTANQDRKFDLELPAGNLIITGDRDRLEQVLGNLLENGVKYSPDGTGISVSVETTDGKVVTSVRDHGIGIPADELAQVFERFHRGRQVSASNYGGLGLGLYISKQIVERHGGTIWVESREGFGTTFHFSLPIDAVS